MKKILTITLLIVLTATLTTCLNITNYYLDGEKINDIAEIRFKNEDESDDTSDSKTESSETDTSQAVVTDYTYSEASETEEGTEAAAETEAPTTSLRLTDITSPISVNNTATVEIVGKPLTEYDIDVIYSTAPSSAKGLENKVTDQSGAVSWSWRIGASVKSGSYKITVTGGGETLETYIQVN